MAVLPIFQGPQHQPFRWTTQDSGPFALLVHGFPGTPAEMRPLGEALHGAGWGVQGMLLPGFGPQIATLGSYHYQDWADAIARDLAPAKPNHHPVLLLGYSLGAALSAQVAVRGLADGLILIAPFLQLRAGLQGKLLSLLKWIFPLYKPFEKANFSDPRTRDTISTFAAGVDLDDQDVQADLRDLSIRSATIDEIRKAGRAGLRAAKHVTVSNLVLQGLQDELANPEVSRHLQQRLSGPTQYREVRAGHDLIRPENPAWPEVKQTVLEFAQSLRDMPLADEGRSSERNCSRSGT